MLDFFQEVNAKQFAIQTLNTYFADRYTELIDVEKGNCPDLIDKEKKIGVEITRATNVELLKGLDAHLKKKPITLNSSYSLDSHVWIPISVPTEIKLEQIKEAYEKKLNKLNEGKYDSVEIVDLFIFSSIKKDVKNEQLLAFVEPNKQKNFRYVYIVSYFSIYEIDSKAKTCKILDFDNIKINEVLEANNDTRYSWL